ncbi:MAG TPA: DinB family protein [Mucilaginibacter sp.]|jgi:hypothetical protein|nr:DinB family protein [Mucilaginibacter sp.]
MENIQDDKREVFIKMVLSNWQTQNSRLSALFDKLSDEELSTETAPGRNTGVYLLGHMTAIHDAMFTILSFRERLYLGLDEAFVENPDKSGLPKPPIGDLRVCWKLVSTILEEHINATQPEDWFKRHNSVSEEDFAKEPHRNKLNIIINRTNHLCTHLGQLTYLSK